MMTCRIERTKLSLQTRMGDWVTVLLPGARLSGSHYRAGSVRGEPGTSLAIDVASGIWFDHATGQKGGPLDLIMAARGIALPEALDWAEGCLGGVGKGATAPVAKKPVQRPLRRFEWPELVTPHERALHAICRNLQIGVEGLKLAAARGHLWLSGKQFTVTDSARYVRADRNLDGTPVRLVSGSQTKSRTLGCATWPVGCADFGERPLVIVAEGFSDFLAGHHLLVSEGMQRSVSVCGMLGASARIHPLALERFAGKAVLIFCDADSPGLTGARRWRDQLDPHCRMVRLYQFKGLTRDDGEPVKDLRDFLRVRIDDWEAEPEVSMPVTQFLRMVFP
jgi:hypothetical protein